MIRALIVGGMVVMGIEVGYPQSVTPNFALASHHIKRLKRPRNPEIVYEVLARKGTYTSAEKTVLVSFWMDYDSTDRWRQIYIYGKTYDWFVWDWNMRYTIADTQYTLPQRYGVIAFHSIIPLPDGVNPPQPISSSNIQVLIVDTVSLIFGHCRDTNLDDTLAVAIVALNANGSPTNTMYWKDTLMGPQIPESIDPATGQCDKLRLTWVDIPVSWTSTTVKRFGVRVDYYGLRDTAHHEFYPLIGYPVKIQSAPCTFGSYDMADTSTLYANTFVLWVEYAQYGLIPVWSATQNTWLDIYYDCNGSGNYEYASDGENFMQNAVFLAKVTVDTITSINNLRDEQLLEARGFYNPSTRTLRFEYTPGGGTSGTRIVLLTSSGQAIYSVVTKPGREKETHTVEIDASGIKPGLYVWQIQTDQATRRGTVAIY